MEGLGFLKAPKYTDFNVLKYIKKS